MEKRKAFETFEFNTSFNRNLFFLKWKGYELKTEFTYFPFTQIEKPKVLNNLKIDSSFDIAVNKLFTIYQNPRSRDYIDLFMLCEKYGYQIHDLLLNAKVKFDWHVDPIKLGSQFRLATKLKDYPILLEKIDKTVWQNFFIKEAKNLEKEIFKK